MTREDGTYSIHYHTKMDIFGYYEWLEIKEAKRNVRSVYKNLIEQELNSLLSRMSKVIMVPPQPAPERRSTTAEGPVLRNETSVKFTAEEILFKRWQVDLSMLNTTSRLPSHAFRYHNHGT